MKLEQQMYEIGDLESLSASVLYTGFLPKMGPGGFGLPKGDSYGFKTPIFRTPEMESEPIPEFKFSGHKLVIPYGNLGIEEVGDLHDTFSVDRYGNLYGGHTTFKGKFHINTDLLKSRDDDTIK